MADNENLGAPQSRNEALLQNILGANYDLGEPQSRNEALLMKIAGEDVDVDFEPQSRIEALLMEIIDQGGGGGGVEVESLSVTENGTYTAEEGTAYSPVTVNVPQTQVESLSVTENGTYTAEQGKAYSPITVEVGGIWVEETISTSGAVTQTLDANTIYHFTGSLTSLTITLNNTQNIPHYHFDFISGATAPTLTMPNSVTMPDDFAVEANKRYEVDVMNNYGAVITWTES